MTAPRARTIGQQDVLIAEVWLWGIRVGVVAEDTSGVVTFEYDAPFRKTELEISPVHLPLAINGPVQFPALRRSETFEGLPGVLADALPDRFGNAVIQQYFERAGRTNATFSPVQKLLYIGARAMGALEFRPAEQLRASPDLQEPLEVARLVEQARQLIEGDASVAIPEMMQIGASAGGARAKALILWNRTTGVVRSGFATPGDGDEHWLIKFDGVGEFQRANADPAPFNRIEYVYSQMALNAGIAVPETHLLEERKLGHFMARRFDRVPGGRLHRHSLGGLNHVDFNTPHQFSYEQYLGSVRALGLGYEALEEAFRRAVFNIAAVNQDDHVKNFEFLMGADGRWALAPAYDLTFARGTGFTRSHQMTLGGKVDDFTRADLLEFGARMGVNKDGAHIIDQVTHALGDWEDLCRAAKVARVRISAIRSAFRVL